jgi:hypothetical protein
MQSVGSHHHPARDLCDAEAVWHICPPIATQQDSTARAQHLPWQPRPPSRHGPLEAQLFWAAGGRGTAPVVGEEGAHKGLALWQPVAVAACIALTSPAPVTLACEQHEQVQPRRRSHSNSSRLAVGACRLVPVLRVHTGGLPLAYRSWWEV